MDFPTAIILYIILLSVLLMTTWRMGIRVFSALTVSALVSAVFLMILIPPSELDRYTNDIIDGRPTKRCNNTAIGLIATIYLATLVLVLWYVLECAYLDHNPDAFSEYPL